MGVTPKALQRRPQLIRRWEYAKELFEELTGSRRYTASGPANIPFSEYYAYASAQGFDQTDLMEFWADLQIVDEVWLVEVAKKQKAAELQAKKGK